MYFLETLVVLNPLEYLSIKLQMFNIFQKTINNPVSFEGIGLHTGKTSTVKILPSAENQGIIFKRVDLKENNLIDAKYTNVTSSNLCTTLENKFQVKVSTVEHLLAALSILGIDNAIIEVNNEEIPIMDGSSKNFLDMELSLLITLN